MKTLTKQLNQQGVRQLLIVQLAVTLVLTVFYMISSGLEGLFSALLGGLVYVLPNAFFAKAVFKHQGARAAKQIMNGFYKGEALKVILSIVLFSVVFALGRIKPQVFFVSYILVLMTHWFAPWIMDNKLNRYSK